MTLLKTVIIVPLVIISVGNIFLVGPTQYIYI
jgi:hypothetical protein